MRVVLTVGETQLGKNLQDSIGKRPSNRKFKFCFTFLSRCFECAIPNMLFSNRAYICI